jgi:hypothetical protein
MKLDLPNCWRNHPEPAKAFFMAGDNDYPLKVGTVVFTDQTTTDVKKLTIRFELVLYEKGVIEGVSLLETMKTMASEVEKVITDFQPLLI